jgi:hypothetical protein
MQNNKHNIIIGIQLILFIILMIKIFSLSINNNYQVCIPNKPKILFLYDSTKLLTTDIINNIWINIVNNYKKQNTLTFIDIDIYKNNAYTNNLDVLPTIFYIDYDNNIILKYPSNQELTYNNLNNFIINSFGSYHH